MDLKVKPVDEKERIKREMIRKLEAKVHNITKSDTVRDYNTQK